MVGRVVPLTPGVKAPNVAGAPSVSDSVAGTVPPTVPGVSVEVGASIVSCSSAMMRRVGRRTASRAAASPWTWFATSSRKKIAVYLSSAVPYFSASARLAFSRAGFGIRAPYSSTRSRMSVYHAGSRVKSAGM